MVFFSGFVNSLFPGVAAGVGEFEAATYLFQSDATSTLVGLRLGVIAVDNFAANAVVSLAESYADITGLGGRDAVLEGVLDEGDKDKRGYLRTVFRPDVEVGFYRDIGCQPDTH